jgi:hypothetical protein
MPGLPVCPTAGAAYAAPAGLYLKETAYLMITIFFVAV